MSRSHATAVSDDGTRVVGEGGYADFQPATFLWTASTGMLNLQDYLIAQGATIPAGWRLWRADDISADGRTVVGVGRNRQGDTEAWGDSSASAWTKPRRSVTC